ncbi:MAG: NUDIX hydrolase [Candidatus Obscuribacterales bacterium]|nr:NUDIX hydrolase [Candidatus Obscuribacterales bacterium]
MAIHPQTRNWLLWQSLSRELIADCKVFSVTRILSESQTADRKRAKFYTLNCSAWVNVIALNSEGSCLMVEQYRHGVEGLTLEIPGGGVEPGDITPLSAAMRELKEETGCEAERWTYLGKNYPNPALQDNLCYTYLAEGVRQVEMPKFDETGTERINSLYIPLLSIGDAIRSGAITHALVIAAFHFLALERPELLCYK